MSIAEKILTITQNMPRVFEAGKVGEEKTVTLPAIDDHVPFATKLRAIAEKVVTVYNAGRASINTENLWDEQWEVGVYSTTTGSFIPEGGSAICVSSHHNHPISVLPSTTYSFASTFRLYVFFYDENNTFISYKGATNENLITPENCHYIRFYVHRDYGKTYLNDIFIRLAE